MRMFLRLWNEETGAIVSAEVMLVASILVIGVIAGIMVILALGLKNRQQELSMLEQNGQSFPATD